jgi:predicted phage-related endonuclease
VTGLSWGSAVVIGHGRTFDWVDVERDQAFIADVLLPACADFWARLRDGRPINPDALDVTKAALARIYPEERDEVVSLGGDWIEKDIERQEIAAQLRALEERKKLIDNELRAAIGSAAAAALPNGVSYTYRTTRRKGYVVEPTAFRHLRRKEAK